MRLQSFTVEGLFGLFDHTIPLNLSERITIVHAPNGYGKTIILKMISGFFGGSLGIFRQYEYSRATFRFHDGSSIAIEQLPGQRDSESESDRELRAWRSYTIKRESDKGTETWNPDRARSQEILRRITPNSLQRYLPFLRRTGTREWRDNLSGDSITFQQALDRYAEQIPISVRHSSPQPTWLEQVRASIHCRLIETQRLVTFDEVEDELGEVDHSRTPAVNKYAQELASSIASLLAESATLSQSLDQTFPSRLLVRVGESASPPTENELRVSLAELDKQRLRLSKAGLLDAADANSWISHEQFNDTTRRILAEYVEDTRKKLSIYDVMLAKLELFTEILNSRYQFKSVSTNRGSGFSFKDHKGRQLAPDSLSSGEQHELVLVFDLLFKTSQNTLILVDEPEISLHIGWQKRFLQDLRRIIELTQIDALLATHSPQLIGKNLDLTVHLRARDGLFDIE